MIIDGDTTSNIAKNTDDDPLAKTISELAGFGSSIFKQSSGRRSVAGKTPTRGRR